MELTRLTTVLNDLGLSEHEAKVYLGALSLGPAQVSSVAKAAEIKRTTAYYVIEQLKLKGLMRMDLKGWKKLYVAEDPAKLHQLVEAKKRNLEAVLPEFESLYNLRGEEGLLKFYEGVESSKSAYEQMIRDVQTGDVYRVISNQELWYSQDPTYFQSFMERRAKLPITIRLILDDSEVSRSYQKQGTAYNMAIKLFPGDLNFTTNFVITPQHLLMHQMTSPNRAIVIDNQAFIQAQQRIFDLLWTVLP